MTPQEFTKAMLYYGEINKKGMPDWKPHVVEFWFKQLGHLDKRQLKTIMDKLICKPFWPSLGEVLEEINPELDSKFQANLIAGNIYAAICRYGSSRLDKVEAMLGPDGWEVVRLSGGWMNVCEVNNNQITTAKAQWRNLAESVLARTEQEKKEMAALPECSQNKQVTEMINQLTEKASF